MPVACHDSQAVGRKIEIQTIHHWSKLVLSSGEERTIDIFSQYVSVNGDYCCTCSYRLNFWELIGRLYREIV